MRRPLITELTDDNISEFAAIDDITVIGQFSQQDSTLHEDLTTVAKKFQDRYSFGIYTLPAQETSVPSQVICRNNLDNLKFRADDFSQVGALEHLLEQCAAPLVMPLNRRTELVFNKVCC